jgi:hypothetical protein
MPLFFFSIAVGAGFAISWRRFSRRGRVILSVLFAALLFGHVVMSVRQALYWNDELTYWTACTKNFPDAITCRNKASWLLETRGRTEESLVHAQAVLQISMYRAPNRPRDAAHNVANILKKMGRDKEALMYLNTSLLFDPLNAEQRKRTREEISEMKKKPSAKK